MPNDQPWPWHDLDHASAARLLGDHLPAAARHALEAFGRGDFCLAFRAGSHVVRVARHPNAAAALRREVCVLAEIAPLLPLAVPRPAYHAPRGCPPFTVHEQVVGEVLTRDGWLGLPPEAREQAAGDMATFFRALHAIPVAIGLECGLLRYDRTAIARTVREAARTRLSPLLDRGTWSQLDMMLARWSSPSPEEGRPSALLHCDVAPGHVLYDPSTGSLTGVIDFGDVAVGDPARDFISIYEDYGPAMLRDVLARYAGEDAPSLSREVRRWYLLESISWTLEMCAAQRGADREHGIAEITREVAAAASP